MEIKIDENKCIGCGTCSAICEEVFEIEGAKAKVKEQLNIPCVDEAIEACPEKAISK